MTLDEAIGLAIKLSRQSQGLSQEEIGASQSFVSDVERGKKSMTVQRLDAFACRLGVHPAALMVQAALIANPSMNIDLLFDNIKNDLRVKQ
jgi:transcriptional regulator with XRE-family HTH domain